MNWDREYRRDNGVIANRVSVCVLPHVPCAMCHVPNRVSVPWPRSTLWLITTGSFFILLHNMPVELDMVALVASVSVVVATVLIGVIINPPTFNRREYWSRPLEGSTVITDRPLIKGVRVVEMFEHLTLAWNQSLNQLSYPSTTSNSALIAGSDKQSNLRGGRSLIYKNYNSYHCIYGF